MVNPTFIPGLELCKMFFHDVVEPILEEQLPNLRYAAALIGSGSEVLGFDTEMSSDHHWGPRVMLFLDKNDLSQYAVTIHEIMANRLPYTFRGYSTNFTSPDPNDSGTQLLSMIDSGSVNHRVETLNLRAYCLEYLGIESNVELAPIDWLTIPGQKLRAMTGGAVYRDDIGELTKTREILSEYPNDVWLYMLAAGWTRISQEEPFMGRTGIVDDELGSRIIASRLVHDLMNLCFLMERQYPPFSKWYGTAFKKLECSNILLPIFRAIFDAADWREREKQLASAFKVVAEMHNALNITRPLPEDVSNFHNRPIMVIHGEIFSKAIKEQICDPEVLQISSMTDIGAVEQFSTSTDILTDTHICRKLRKLYL